MTTVSLNSDRLVNDLDTATARTVRALHRRGVYPLLAVVAVGKAAESFFVRQKKARAATVGVEVNIYALPAKVTKKQLREVVEWLNQDEGTAGIIIQLPLPDRFSDDEVEELLQVVAPAKDVDGLGRGRAIPKKGDVAAQSEAATKEGAFLPTTAEAMLRLAALYELELDSVLVIGRGRLVGQPLLELLQAAGCQPKSVDKESGNLATALLGAKTVFCGTNATTPFLNDDYLPASASVIAAGGEIDYPTLEGYAAALTPKKGGVGPLTISLLLRNTVAAAKNKPAKK